IDDVPIHAHDVLGFAVRLGQHVQNISQDLTRLLEEALRDKLSAGVCANHATQKNNVAFGCNTVGISLGTSPPHRLQKHLHFSLFVSGVGTTGARRRKSSIRARKFSDIGAEQPARASVRTRTASLRTRTSPAGPLNTTSIVTELDPSAVTASVTPNSSPRRLGAVKSTLRCTVGIPRPDFRISWNGNPNSSANQSSTTPFSISK